MKTRIVRIGNSQGIRIPKLFLEQAGLQGEVEILVDKSSLVIRPVKQPREGWSQAFQEMSRRGEDKLLDPDMPSLTSWDEEEWEW
jgi:antitoxin MazE